MPNNPLQQTGHAANGLSCFSVASRVSRLRSEAFGEEGRMEAVAINAVLRSLQEYHWGWRTTLPEVRFLGKLVHLRVDTQPIPTGGPSPPLDAAEIALVHLVLSSLLGLLPEVERHFRSHADSEDMIERLHEPSVWLSRDILAEEGPDHWSFVAGIADALDWTICAEFAGLGFQDIWSGD